MKKTAGNRIEKMEKPWQGMCVAFDDSFTFADLEVISDYLSSNYDILDVKHVRDKIVFFVGKRG